MLSSYEPGMENASEHDRNGAFHYWLKREPNKEKLKRLVALSYSDPDQIMAESVREHISKADACDPEIMLLLENGPSRE